MKFSEVLKDICTQEGITLKAFSELTGISYQQIRNYSSSRKVPNYANLLKIANAPGLSKYRTALLGDPAAVNDEIQTLIQILIEQGQEQQVLALLKEIRSESGHANESGEDASEHP
jgi:transcriptional regulator with XRE-family HTH domain